MAKSQRLGLYPGTFDPITLGHIDIIQRAARVVDRLVIGVAQNAGKAPLFTTLERVQMVKDEVEVLKRSGTTNIVVMPFDNLLMDFAVSLKASVVIRGLRAVSDFEYEFQMAAMNYRMNPEVETIFLTANEGTQFISSRFVKEIARLDGKVQSFVSKRISQALKKRFKEPSGRQNVVPEVRD